MRGKSQLYASEPSCRYLFWDRIQGQEPDPGAVWTDTGVTVIGYAGTLYNMSEVVVMTIGRDHPHRGPGRRVHRLLADSFDPKHLHRH